MRIQLKRLSEKNLNHALEKAEKYRDLNQPEEAESICRDVLAVAQDHQPTLRTLGLALTDRYRTNWVRLHAEALAVFGRLSGAYERAYYTGIAWERCAKAQLEQEQGRGAYDAFHQALSLFERAESLADSTNPDPILRWNRCVRELTTHPLLLAAASSPASSDMDFGDGPPG